MLLNKHISHALHSNIDRNVHATLKQNKVIQLKCSGNSFVVAYLFFY